MQILFICASLIPLQAAQNPSPAASWELLLAGGEFYTGRAFTATAQAVRCGDSPEVPWSRVVQLRRADRPSPRLPQGPHLIFRNRDRWAGTLTGLDQRALTYQPPGKQPAMKVPLSRVETILLAPDATSTPAPEFANARRDLVRLRNGDRLLGNLAGLAGEGAQLVLEAEGKNREVPLAQIQRIDMNPELAAVRAPEGPYWQATLRDGSRVSLSKMEWDDASLRGTTLYRGEWSIPRDEVVMLRQLQGPAQPLSALNPSREEATAYLREKPQWYRDQGPEGRALTLQTPQGLGGFDRGLSMGSRSRLTFPLKGKAAWLVGQVGLDPELGRQGHVDVAILADGKPLAFPAGKGLTLQAGAVPIRLELGRAQELTLEVDWGEGGPIGDRVNWCDLLLLAKP